MSAAPEILLRPTSDSYAVPAVRELPCLSNARMTIRLDAATRRKVERLAAREGISLNQALSRLLRVAPDEARRPAKRRRYRLRPRKVGFGFDIANARQLATEMSDARALHEQKRRR